MLYRVPKLPIKRFDEDIFRDHAKRLFGVSEGETLSMLVGAVEAAVEQRHGTMLVITAEAEREATRLENQSTVIHPIPISKDIKSLRKDIIILSILVT